MTAGWRARASRAWRASIASPDRPLIVVGLEREARIARAYGPVAIGAAGLERALRERHSGLISFGLCGGLDPELRVGAVVVGDAVVWDGGRARSDPSWREALISRLPAANSGDVAGGGMVGGIAEKSALRSGAGAIAADMESHLVAQAALAASLPFAVLRVVSDDARGALPRSAMAGFHESGQADVGAVLAALCRRPWELPALVRVALQVEVALKILSSAATAAL